MVSGIKPHSPLFEIFNSPARCISVISLGRVLKSRFSEKTAWEASASILSTSLSVFEFPLKSSTTSEVGSPSLASFDLYSSKPCSIRTELTVSRISEEVR